MRILVIHNRYKSLGGEDRVFENEVDLLKASNLIVATYLDDNRRIRLDNQIQTGLGCIWNHRSYRSVQKIIREFGADIVHLHNTFPLVSPAVVYAAHARGAGVVQTLHNYRLLCPSGALFRDGKPCESCIERESFLPGILHGCYRNPIATATVAGMLSVHRAVGTWRNRIDAYIALSEFAQRKFVAGGLPANRIIVKPNFLVRDPGAGHGNGGYALFVGRLSEEKGIRVLADAWRNLPDVPLLVAGDGPLKDHPWATGIRALGPLPQEQALGLMRSARIMIVPSICYENAPMTIVEAFACGLPVIASNLGSLPEFVDHRRTGLLFRPGDAQDLARQVRWAFDNPKELAAMRVAARREYEEKYSAERNYKLLIGIYEMAIENARRRQREAS